MCQRRLRLPCTNSKNLQQKIQDLQTENKKLKENLVIAKTSQNIAEYRDEYTGRMLERSSDYSNHLEDAYKDKIMEYKKENAELKQQLNDQVQLTENLEHQVTVLKEKLTHKSTRIKIRKRSERHQKGRLCDTGGDSPNMSQGSSKDKPDAEEVKVSMGDTSSSFSESSKHWRDMNFENLGSGSGTISVSNKSIARCVTITSSRSKVAARKVVRQKRNAAGGRAKGQGRRNVVGSKLNPGSNVSSDSKAEKGVPTKALESMPALATQSAVPSKPRPLRQTESQPKM